MLFVVNRYVFFEGHDGVPVERNPNMSSRTCAVLEHRTLTAGEIKRKKDENFDEISDNVDTFRTFTDIPVESNYFDEVTNGNDQELNKLNSQIYSAVHFQWNLRI